MSSVCTVSATMVGADVQHGLTRMRWQTAAFGVPAPSDVSAALAAMIGFWTAINGSIVGGVAIDPVDVAIVQDVATGLTTDAVSAASVPAGTTGTGGGSTHVSGTGCRVTWRTGIRRASRELRGATFVVPMDSGSYTSSGNVASGTIATIAAAANTYLTAMVTAGLVPVVYGRPLPATTHHGVLAGETGSITLADVGDVPAFLRRRRS